MFTSTFTSWDSIGEIVVRSTPIILAALAVTVPARAGLINVGGEGQMIIGGIGAMGVSLPSTAACRVALTLVLMVLAAAVGGAAWSLIAAVLRQYMNISESVTTLLLNYVALDLMFFLIYDRWKDRNGTGQPTTRALPVSERLPLIGWGRVHAGLFIALGAAVIIAVVFRSTSWGFRLRVVGGNAEAARRSGLKVGHAAAVGDGRRRRARRPRRAHPARRRRVQAAPRVHRHLRLHRLPRLVARAPPTAVRRARRRCCCRRSPSAATACSSTASSPPPA